MSSPQDDPDMPPLSQSDPDDGWDDETSPGVNAASYGLATNEHQGTYHRGVPYDVKEKLRVADAIKRQGNALNFSAVSKECKVSRFFVRKVWGEMLCHGGRVVDPKTITQRRVRGAGEKTFDEFDHCILIILYLEEPSRSNASYVENLHMVTGTRTSTSTISRWFNTFFPIKGSFCRPNMVPVDKFKPENLWKAEEYLAALAVIAPKRLRFGDEKLIKGSEVFCRKTRRNVLTGK